MQKRWQTLQECLGGCTELLILLHDDPDPDAVASGVALQFLAEERLGLTARIAHRGVIGRAENRALVAFLEPQLEMLADETTPERRQGQAMALLDTQPGSGNSPLPADFEVEVVIDHHGDRADEKDGTDGTVCLRDVRPWIGASSTILTQYLQAAQIKPSSRIATALFYGIKTDTKALSRDTSAADVSAYFYLLECLDVDALVEIENAQVPADYFRSLNRAMQNARIYDGVVLSFLGRSDYPDLAAEVADMFLRLEGVHWVVCLGAYEEDMYVSVRARSESNEVDAEDLVRQIIGDRGTAGGRNTLAGGQLPLQDQDPEQVALDIRRRVLAYLGVSEDAEASLLVS